MKKLKGAFWIGVAAIFAVSCATPPKPKTISKEEEKRQEREFGLAVAEHLEEVFRFKRDENISLFMKKLTLKLLRKKDEGKYPIGVFMIRDRDRRWQSYSVPGTRIYLSLGLVKALKNENELAAVLALELAHIKNRHLIYRYAEVVKEEIIARPSPGLDPKPKKFFRQGLFKYTEEQYEEAIGSAIQYLYNAGYDVRGLTTLWNVYKRYPKNSPYSKELIRKFVNWTRNTVVEYAPLRNPIVRTNQFVAIQKRIQKL